MVQAVAGQRRRELASTDDTTAMGGVFVRFCQDFDPNGTVSVCLSLEQNSSSISGRRKHGHLPCFVCGIYHRTNGGNRRGGLSSPCPVLPRTTNGALLRAQSRLSSLTCI